MAKNSQINREETSYRLWLTISKAAFSVFRIKDVGRSAPRVSLLHYCVSYSQRHRTERQGARAAGYTECRGSSPALTALQSEWWPRAGSSGPWLCRVPKMEWAQWRFKFSPKRPPHTYRRRQYVHLQGDITAMGPGPLRSTDRVSSSWKAHMHSHANQKAACKKVNRWGTQAAEKLLYSKGD